jgi:hypothetical protein
VTSHLVPPAGLEPAAYRLGGGRSIHLSYEGARSTVAPCRRLAATWPDARPARGRPGRELNAIDDEWNAKGAAVETIEVPLEKSNIQVVARSLVRVPVG